jgi:predicted dehydrogenase
VGSRAKLLWSLRIAAGARAQSIVRRDGRLRTAVIGAGRMGRRHIHAVRQMGLELVGVSDLKADALAVASQECELPPATLFSEAETLFRNACPECVIVATTADSHQCLTSQAALNGAKYILCEKPMATSLAQCDAMIADCTAHGTRLAINHYFRFTHLHQSIRRALESERLGGLTSFTVVAANIGMAMNGTHLFELFQNLTGEPPQEVTAWLVASNSPNPRGSQFQDPGGAIRITTRSGKRFYMEAGVEQGHGITITYGAKHGQLLLDLLQGTICITRRQERDRGLPNSQYGTPSEIELLHYVPDDAITGTEAVLENLLSGGEIPSGTDGRQTIAILAAAYLSSENAHCPIRADGAGLPLERVFPWP